MILKILRFILFTYVAYVFVSLTGCGLFPDTPDETAGWSAQRLYTRAKDALNGGDYTAAIKYYETLEARYPFERFAQQALLDMIYAYYKSDEPESAIATADRFIKTYPRHAYVDYAYYLKGLVYFERNIGLFDRFLPLDRSQRDQKATLQSFQAFSELVKQFPNSKYNEDAKQRMLFLRNSLANYELHVARFYMHREAYVAAINRAKKIVEAYQRTPAVPEALVILAKAYKIIGLDDLSANAIQVLKLNFPDHQGIAQVEELEIR